MTEPPARERTSVLVASAGSHTLSVRMRWALCPENVNSWARVQGSPPSPNPKPITLNPKRETLNPTKPKTLNLRLHSLKRGKSSRVGCFNTTAKTHSSARSSSEKGERKATKERPLLQLDVKSSRFYERAPEFKARSSNDVLCRGKFTFGLPGGPNTT